MYINELKVYHLVLFQNKTPSMSSSGYSSNAFSSTTLSSDDSLSMRSISVDDASPEDTKPCPQVATDSLIEFISFQGSKGGVEMNCSGINDLMGLDMSLTKLHISEEDLSDVPKQPIVEIRVEEEEEQGQESAKLVPDSDDSEEISVGNDEQTSGSGRFLPITPASFLTPPHFV